MMERPMRSAILAAMIAGAALSGCAQTPEEIAAADTATCASYGLPTGHPDHGFCRMMLDQRRAQAEAAEKAARAGNAGLSLAGAVLLQRSMGY